MAIHGGGWDAAELAELDPRAFAAGQHREDHRSADAKSVGSLLGREERIHSFTCI
jgi:hypothetical protein